MMSFAVVRGKPEPSQLYLDGVLDSIIQDGGSRATTREGVNLAEVFYYCLRTNPGGIHSINAATGEKFTNQQVLKRAVSIARALTARCPRQTVIIMLQNHEHMSALFYAVLLAGVVPFMMAPESTESDFRHYLPLISPRLVFCEPDRRDDVTNAVRRCALKADVVAADGPSLDKFVRGHSNHIDSYQHPAMKIDSTAILLGTSGTTGRPKAAMLDHRGSLMQIPSHWLHDTQFPQPTQLAFLLSTAQWLTHTVVMITCPVYQVPILMSPEKISPDKFLELSEKYRGVDLWGTAADRDRMFRMQKRALRIIDGKSVDYPAQALFIKHKPTWGLISPMLAADVGHLGNSEQLSSFSKLLIVGSPFSADTITPLKDKLSVSASLLNAYGMTEMQGQIAMGKQGTPLASVGNVHNIFKYRIVNSDGKDVSKPYERGELYLKSKCIFKGYLKNGAVDQGNLTPDGWLKTEDIFYTDEEGQLFFATRTKLFFIYTSNNLKFPVFPEEVERVIDTVPGVQKSVVSHTDSGPAAAVVLQPGHSVSRESIHQAVNSTLTDWNRLRGGIAFVSALPRNTPGRCTAQIVASSSNN